MTALTFEGLAARAGDAVVRVVRSTGGAHIPMRLDEFLRYCRRSTDADPWYLRGWPDRETHAEWRALIHVPPSCVSWLEDLPPAAARPFTTTRTGPRPGTPCSRATSRGRRRCPARAGTASGIGR